MALENYMRRGVGTLASGERFPWLTSYLEEKTRRWQTALQRSSRARPGKKEAAREGGLKV
jgi:hypothetical protein